MSGHQRAKTEVVVEVVVAIEIAEMRTLAFLHKDWVRIVSAVVAGDAERNPFQILLVRLRRFGRAALKGVQLVLQVSVHHGSPEISSR